MLFRSHITHITNITHNITLTLIGMPHDGSVAVDVCGDMATCDTSVVGLSVAAEAVELWWAGGG